MLSTRMGEKREHDCLRRVMVLMMAADDDVDDDEIATIIRVYQETTGTELEADTLRAEVESLPAGLRIGDCGGQLLAEGLDVDARIRVLGAAFAVAAADGFIVEEEDTLLRSLANDLEIDEPSFDKAIRRFMAG